MSENALSISSLDNNLSRYIKEIQQFPMLTQEEEYDLATRLKESADLEAAHKLVTSHLRLVAKIALKFRNYGVPLMDLVAEGNIGLMKAVKKFEPEMGFRLSTYAIWWIKASIQDYILKTWSILKIGSSTVQKKLFYNLNKVKNKLLNHEKNSSDRSKIAELDIPPVVSLNQSSHVDSQLELQDTISDDIENQEETTINKQDLQHKAYLLKSALNELSDREKDIIVQRKLQEKPVTLDVLSQKYSVSSERIRQIEEKSMKKIKAYVETYAT